MPVNNQELMTAMRIIAEQQNLRVTVKESLKGGCIAGSCAAAGGVLGGPLGLAVGGTIGAITAAIIGSGKYRSVAQIIAEDMTPRQQKELADALRNAVQEIRLEDFTILLPLLLNNQSIQQQAVQALMSYMQQEMQMQVII